MDAVYVSVMGWLSCMLLWKQGKEQSLHNSRGQSTIIPLLPFADWRSVCSLTCVQFGNNSLCNVRALTMCSNDVYGLKPPGFHPLKLLTAGILLFHIVQCKKSKLFPRQFIWKWGQSIGERSWYWHGHICFDPWELIVYPRRKSLNRISKVILQNSQQLSVLSQFCTIRHSKSYIKNCISISRLDTQTLIAFRGQCGHSVESQNHKKWQCVLLSDNTASCFLCFLRLAVSVLHHTHLKRTMKWARGFAHRKAPYYILSTGRTTCHIVCILALRRGYSQVTRCNLSVYF